jgi:predicted GIY-YIG superfamily endonuclease
MAGHPTVVYRAFDADDQLLYVGVTQWLPRRREEHQRTSAWSADAVRWESELHPTRKHALAAEWVAIREERPQWNRPATDRFRPTFLNQIDITEPESNERASRASQ